jgi:hypothetical protein
MAKIKSFYNAPTMVQFIREGNGAEQVVAALNVSNRLMVQNALNYAKRNLDAEVLVTLNETLDAVGGPIKAAKAGRSQKEWKAKITAQFTKDCHADIKSLVLGFCNTKGGLVEQTGDGLNYSYGIEPEHAKFILEKMAGVAGVSIKMAK